MVEHVRSSNLDPYATSLSGVQSILDASAGGTAVPVEVADAIVEELDAAGYLETRDGHGVTVLPESHGGRVSIAHGVLDDLVTQLVGVLSVSGDINDPQSSTLSVTSVDLDPVRQWSDRQGMRAQTWLAIAWEHGWVSHASRLAAVLSRMWIVLGKFDHAAAALAVAQDAESAAAQERMADLWACRTRAFSDAHRYDDAVESATSALLCALETGSHDRVAAAYDLRGDMCGRAGRLAESVRDLWIADRHARQAVRRAPLGDRSCVRIDPKQVEARLTEAKARLEAAAVSSAWAWGPSAEEQGLLATAYVAHSLIADNTDEAGVYLARVVRESVTALPDAAAARIATTLGQKAQTSGLLDVAISYFDLAVDRYDSVGRHDDATATRVLRDRVMARPVSSSGSVEVVP
ncbi:hypothetical protein AOZ06_05250 [Kibdelosporangium phytohabitans]|uniref:Uncharacterized protein n=1 Tax=Kibdelosporangium phytohabitans TaxID=860235 RepID=A0A0N9HP51_9PSEU|nr:hypothetical protein AOZ06_05250 [Kibdelosporangium phytohabitans]